MRIYLMLECIIKIGARSPNHAQSKLPLRLSQGKEFRHAELEVAVEMVGYGSRGSFTDPDNANVRRADEGDRKAGYPGFEG